MAVAKSTEPTNKAEFLQRVREALGRKEPLLYPPNYPPLKSATIRQEEKIQTVLARNAARRPRLLERLAENAGAAGWNVHRVWNPEDTAQTVADIAKKAGAKNVVRSSEDVFKPMDLDGALRRARIKPIVLASSRSRPRADLTGIAFDADMGVTGVSYAIAETASCVITPRRGLARITSLAPPVYVAVVRAEQVIESLDDYFALVRLQYQRTRGRGVNYANFISGPSRTADIEQTLTIGVHGPGEVHLVLVS